MAVRYSVGTVRVRTFRRSKDQRAFVKVAEPNTWELRAHVVWKSANGPIPPGMGIHHADGNKLNDAVGNLELVSKAAHLEIHRPEFHHRCIANLVAARRARRWSTKSATKRVGRPPHYTEEAMREAVASVRRGLTAAAAARACGVSREALYRVLRRPA